MSHNSGITFYTDSGDASDMFLKDVSSMDDTAADYTQCEVDIVAGKGAVWIVYTEERYGRSGSGQGRSFVVYPDTSGYRINVGFRIKSAQAFDVSYPCVALFEHSEYRGFLCVTDDSLKNITQQFPAGHVGGASSAIALSGSWVVWSLMGYKGTKVQILDALQNRQEVNLFRNNDKGKSVQLVRS